MDTSDAAVGEGRPEARPAWWEWLFVPFRYVSGEVSLIIGVAAILAAGAIGSVSNTHFDGVLDMHTGAARPVWVFLAEGFIDWLCLAVILLVLGRLLSRTAFRVIDLVGTQAWARWPMVVAVLATLLPGYQRMAAALPSMLIGGHHGAMGPRSVADIVQFGVAALVSLLSIVWMVALMYQSYRTCTNQRGLRVVVSFVLGVLLAEVASKYALFGVMTATGVAAWLRR